MLSDFFAHYLSLLLMFLFSLPLLLLDWVTLSHWFSCRTSQRIRGKYIWKKSSWQCAVILLLRSEWWDDWNRNIMLLILVEEYNTQGSEEQMVLYWCIPLKYCFKSRFCVQIPGSVFIRNRPLTDKKAVASIIFHICTTDIVNCLKMVTKEQLWHSAIKRTGNTDL